MAHGRGPLAPLRMLWRSDRADAEPRSACRRGDPLHARVHRHRGLCPLPAPIITGLYPMQSGSQYMRTMAKSSALNEIQDPARRQEAKDRPVYEATPPEGVRCFTEYLRAAGYYCTNNEKQDYQFAAPVTAWDESSKKAHWRESGEGAAFFRRLQPQRNPRVGTAWPRRDAVPA